MTILEVIKKFKDEWSQPRVPIHSRGTTYAKVVCTFAERGVNQKELDCLRIEIPISLEKFWKNIESACLFKDIEYGQWGLIILNPKDSIKETELYKTQRKRCHQKDDLIIGKFIGDSELLLIRCDKKSNDFGNIMVVDEITPRYDWYLIESNFENFLEQYLKHQGEKYWELRL